MAETKYRSRQTQADLNAMQSLRGYSEELLEKM